MIDDNAATRNSDVTLLHPIFKAKLITGLQLALQAGLDIHLFEGWRSPTRQGVLYAQGRSTPGELVTDAPPWESFHQFGLAADLVFKNSADKWTWSGNYKAVAMILKAQGLEWAGDWVHFRELPHFQLTGGLTIADANAIMKHEGLLGVWARVSSATAARTSQPSLNS